MNCRTFDKRLIELLDTQPDPTAISELLQHAEAHLRHLRGKNGHFLHASLIKSAQAYFQKSKCSARKSAI